MAGKGGKISPGTEFKKGQSGNPKGRPPGVPTARTRMKRFLELIMKEQNPITSKIEGLTVAEIADLKVIKKAMDGDLAAWNMIQDRLEGKPVQPNDNTFNFPMP